MGNKQATSIARFARAGGAVIVLAVLFAIVPASETLAQADISIHGYLSTQYRMRQSEDESDQDIYQYVGLDLGDELTGKVTAHLLLRLAADIDGKQEVPGYYVFDSVTDTYDESFTYWLYHSYLDFHRVGNVADIRLGRQVMYDTPVTLYFDGGKIETMEWREALNLKVGVYGGVPVHLYEIDAEGDAIYGALLQTRPWRGGRFRADWVRVEDENLYGEEENDFYSAAVWQALSQYLMAHARYGWLDNEGRDVTGRLSFYHPDWDLMVMVSYYELLETEEIRTIDFDPFFAAAHAYYPYWQGRFLASKGIGDNFGIEGGVDMRELNDENDMSNYNHEFIRYFGTVYLTDLPTDGLEISATGEVWDSQDQLEYIQSYGGDVTYKTMNDRLAMSVGSYFSLYEYDFYVDEEKEEVQTYYGRIRFSQRKGFGFDVTYQYEDDEFDEYQTLKVGTKFVF